VSLHLQSIWIFVHHRHSREKTTRRRVTMYSRCLLIHLTSFAYRCSSNNTKSRKYIRNYYNAFGEFHTDINRDTRGVNDIHAPVLLFFCRFLLSDGHPCFNIVSTKCYSGPSPALLGTSYRYPIHRYGKFRRHSLALPGVVSIHKIIYASAYFGP
jgi:hypothetical protein